MDHKYGNILGFKNITVILIIIFFVAVVLGTYYDKISAELGVLTSIITFIYGFFINSLFNFIQRKYSDFSLNLADLSANIQSLYNLAKLTRNNGFISKMESDLKKLVVSVKELHPREYDETQKLLDQVFNNLDKYEIRNKKQEVLFARMINVVKDIAVNRERIELFGVRYLTGETMFLFYSLTALVTFSILSISIKLHVFFIFGVVLILALIFMTGFIYNLDRNRYGKQKIRVKNLDALLESLK